MSVYRIEDFYWVKESNKEKVLAVYFLFYV